MTFDNAKGQTEHGDLAFALAVIAGYFHVIAYCNVATPAAAATLQSVLQQTSYYRLAKVVQLSTDIGPVELLHLGQGTRHHDVPDPGQQGRAAQPLHEIWLTQAGSAADVDGHVPDHHRAVG